MIFDERWFFNFFTGKTAGENELIPILHIYLYTNLPSKTKLNKMFKK